MKTLSKNRTMESFAVEHVSNLSSKIILAEVAMSNFMAQHNLSLIVYIRSTQICSKIRQKNANLYANG